MSKILIIEDEASIRRVLNKILSEENDTYKVEEAEDGVQGLEKSKIPITIWYCATSKCQKWTAKNYWKPLKKSNLKFRL